MNECERQRKADKCCFASREFMLRHFNVFFTRNSDYELSICLAVVVVVVEAKNERENKNQQQKAVHGN